MEIILIHNSQTSPWFDPGLGSLLRSTRVSCGLFGFLLVDGSAMLVCTVSCDGLVSRPGCIPAPNRHHDPDQGKALAADETNEQIHYFAPVYLLQFFTFFLFHISCQSGRSIDNACFLKSREAPAL